MCVSKLTHIFGHFPLYVGKKHSILEAGSAYIIRLNCKA
jgi:hypothetical protein